jgi:hypothetical protein
VGVLLALAVSVAAGSAGAAGPDPQEVYVQWIAYGGTGCPQGTVGHSLSADRTTFTLLFDAYIASSGPGIPVTENRKNCQLTIGLHTPPGWSYTLFTIDYRGFVQLAPGMSAEAKSTYYFSGETSQVSGRTRFAGPIARDFLVRDAVLVLTQEWSPCSTSSQLNMNTQFRLVDAGVTRSQITHDSTDSKAEFIMGLQWRHCAD